MTDLARIDKQIAQAMRLQAQGCDQAQELIDRLFTKRDAIKSAR